MGFLSRKIRERFEENKPRAITADVRMISGCHDTQTSADVSNVANFQLPDPAGKAGGACTSVLLSILYEDHQKTGADLSFVQVLDQMREVLEAKKFKQIPQLTATQPIDVSHTFDLVPESATGTRRAVLVGINYVGAEQGELRGCHNDALNMVEYIKDVHGFEDENITLLLDDGEHTSPTKDNILAAYKKLISESEAGDAIFIHYSGHGATIKDDDKDEADGADETLVPVDYAEVGMIRDDDLFEALIKPLPENVHVVCLFDCCHSGTVLDLPYIYKADGTQSEMEIDENFDFKKFFAKFDEVIDKVEDVLGDDFKQKVEKAKGKVGGFLNDEKVGDLLGEGNVNKIKGFFN